MKPRTTLVLAAAIAFSGAAFAADNNSSANSGGDKTEQQMQSELKKLDNDPKAAEKLFVLEAAEGNLREQQLGKEVQQKAQNQQVKELAQRIETDHKNAQQQLEGVARSLNLQLPQSCSDTDQAKLKVLTSLPPQQMEKQFAVMQEADHAKDILEYQAMSQTAQDQQVKQYAQQTLPILQEHEHLAMQAAQAVGAPSSMEPITASGTIPPGGGMQGGGNQR